MGYWQDNYGPERSREFIEGVIAGATGFAVLKDGILVIGTYQIPLEEIIKIIKRELGWKPEWDTTEEPETKVPEITHDTRDVSVETGTYFQIRSELASIINRYSLENNSDTPDFILSEFLWSCLQAFNRAMLQRKIWHSNGTGAAKDFFKEG
jgi:hypothetical protein